MTAPTESPRRCQDSQRARTVVRTVGYPRDPPALLWRFGRTIAGRKTNHQNVFYKGAPDPMAKTVILGSARTPVGKLGGGLSSLKAVELGGIAIEAALERSGVSGDQIQHVDHGQRPAGRRRSDPVAPGPDQRRHPEGSHQRDRSTRSAPRACAQSACSTARSAPATSRSVVGGGMESMSNAPYLLPQARFGYRMGDGKMIDAMIHDGLTNPFTGKHMAHEASEVAAEIEMTRADMDRWSVRSHELAAEGQRRGQAARGDRRRHGQGQARATPSSSSTSRPAPTPRSRASPSCRRSS